MQKAKKEIADFLEKELKIENVDGLLTIPPDPKMGDLAFPCFELAKKWQDSPQNCAKRVVDIVRNLWPFVREIKANGPYVNFFFQDEFLGAWLKDFLPSEVSGEVYRGEEVVIEYISPNTNKPLHLGHLRQAVCGQAWYGLLNKNSASPVYQTTLVNDRGIHICKSMLAYKLWGGDDCPERSNMKGDHFVGKYYVMYGEKEKEMEELKEELQNMLVAWEEGDSEVRKLWEQMNTWFYQGFEQTLERLGIKFDKTYLESEHYQKGKDKVLAGLDKGLFYKRGDGAILVDLPEVEADHPITLLRSDGTSGYLVQDIGLAYEKIKNYKKASRFIYTTGVEQEYHFRVLFAILRKLNFPVAADKLIHLPHGMVKLTTGKMSSRQGNVITVDEFLDEMEGMALKEVSQRENYGSSAEAKVAAGKIAQAAIRFHLLNTGIRNDIVFDPKATLSFTGDTGPYLQYGYARIKSVFRQGGVDFDQFKCEKTKIGDEERMLAKKVLEYPDAIEASGQDLNPATLCKYLLDLAHEYNSFYQQVPILESGDKRDTRLAVCKKVAEVIKDGLETLGIAVVDKM